MKSSTLCACIVSCCAAFGQQPSAKTFEVASIKPASPSPMGQIRIGMNTDAGMMRYTNVSLKECIRVAFHVKDFQVQGPDWLDNTRFDITAKLPDGSSEEQIPEMLQALLAERFKLKVHRDKKDHPIYALVVGKGGPKLKPAEVPTGEPAPADGGPASANPRRGLRQRGGMMVQVDAAGAHLKAPSATLELLADMISNFSERPVVDMTDIKGQYDFDLVFSPETLRRMPGAGRGPAVAMGGGERSASEAPPEPAASIYDSVQRYGLKMEPRKAPMDIIVVDHIEKEPTEN
jgi:uncharacterized protein (TIGR03435 family)